MMKKFLIDKVNFLIHYDEVKKQLRYVDEKQNEQLDELKAISEQLNELKAISEQLKYQHYLIEENQYYLSKMNSISEIQTHAFAEFKNINQGKKVMLVATGPSLNQYKKIDVDKYCGVNTAFLYKHIKFDYIFSQDYRSKTKETLIQLRDYDCEKFFGIEPFDFCLIPEQDAILSQGRRYYCLHKEYGVARHQFNLDLCNEPLEAHDTIAFAAMQFLLWTNPAEIYLVGCDCTDSGHFDGSPSAPDSQLYICDGWKKLKEFANNNYPDTKIISVNPIGLKGLFEDLYQ